MVNIDKLITVTVDQLWKISEKALAEKGSVPFAVLFGFEDHIIPGPPMGNLSKDAYTHLLELSTAILKPKFAVRISEAWSLATATKEEAMLASSAGSLEFHPKRIEVVVINWKRAGGIGGMEIREIKRGADGTATLAGPTIQDTGTSISDLFFNNLSFS